MRWENDLRNASGHLRTTHPLPGTACIHGPSMYGSTPMVMPHVHGGHIKSRFDGHPDYQFAPGRADEYEYENRQRTGTLWYHDHALGITRLNV